MRLEQLACGEIVLSREDFRGSHERGLVSVLDGNHCRFKRDESFARSNIALQQAAHGNRCLHVCGDLSQDFLLRGGWAEGEKPLNGRAHAIIQLVADPCAPAEVAALEFQADFEKKQLLKEAAVRGSAATL